MPLPLLARGLASIISTEALIGGEVLSKELVALAETQLGHKANDTSITIPVASSCIRSISFQVGDVITVEFIRGGSLIYEYIGNEELFMTFISAPSKGQFFNAHIKHTDRVGVSYRRSQKSWAVYVGQPGSRSRTKSYYGSATSRREAIRNILRSGKFKTK